VGGEEGLVVGYLGGIQERKGYRRIIEGVRGASDIILLMGGSHGDHFHSATGDARVRFVGLVDSTSEFYAACDVFVVPSLFEPLGMVAFEAASCGVPVICTPEVGALPHFLEFGAGEMWTPPEPIGPLARWMAANREQYLPRIQAMANHLSEPRYARRLLEICNDIATAKRTNLPSADSHVTRQPATDVAAVQ
jgi:glycosyltransferase involved in cell wall biosynthesis